MTVLTYALGLLQRLGSSDCERIAQGFLHQPMNAVSSLAFVVAGTAIFLHGRQRIADGIMLFRLSLLSMTAAAVGVGSFLFHGPMPGIARWLHDASIMALLWMLVVIAGRASGPLVPLAGVAGAGLVALIPSADLPVSATLLAVLVALELRVRGGVEPWRSIAMVVVVVGGAFAWLGRTSGPWCDPDGWIQLHALWHVMAATAFVLYIRSGPRMASYRMHP